MASRPIELPDASGAGWLRTLTGPVGKSMLISLRIRLGLAYLHQNITEFETLFEAGKSTYERLTCSRGRWHIEDFGSWLTGI